MPDDTTLIENLRYLVRRAERDFEVAESNYLKRKERLEKAKEVLRYEEERLGKRRIDGRFVGFSVKDAAITVIREAAPHALRAQVIWEKLRDGGCSLGETKFPGRALHAALIGVPRVTKAGDSRYQWVPETNSSAKAAPSELEAGGLG